MPAYANVSGDSPITSYEVEANGRWIDIVFRGRGNHPARVYRYKADETDITTLIELALTGQGLATHIARTKPDHSTWWTLATA